MTDEAQRLLDEGKRPEALAKFGEALDRAKRLGDRPGRVVAAIGLAKAHLALGGRAEARAALDEAALAAEGSGDKAWLGSVLREKARLLAETGETDDAQAALEESVRVSAEGGDHVGAAEAGLTIAVWLETSDPEESLRRAEQSRAVFARSGQAAYEVLSLIVAGTARSRLLDDRGAVETLATAARTASEAGLLRLEGEALARLGQACEDMGQYAAALNCHDRALRIAAAMGDESATVARLLALGSWCEAVGQMGLAETYFQRALGLARLSGDQVGEARALQSLGTALHRQGRSDTGLRQLEAAMALCEGLGDRIGLARCLASIGEVARDRREFARARDALERAVSAFRDEGAPLDAATATNSLGNVAFDEGDFEQAAAAFGQAAREHDALGARMAAATSLANRAEALYRLDRCAEAEKDYVEALTRFEAVRIGLGDLTEAKTSHLGRRAQVYQQFADVLTRLGRPNESFDVVQRMKARALLDLLTMGRATIETGMTDEERETERKLRTRAEELAARMLAEGVRNRPGSKLRYEALAKELREAENRLEEFTSALYARRPRLKDARMAATMTSEEAGKLLPEDTALVEFAVSEYAVNIIVLRKENGTVRIDGSSRKVYLPDLRERAAALRRAVTTAEGQWEELARGLYDDLIRPVAKSLAGKRRWVVCPDGCLWDVPFAVLMPGPGQCLIDRHEVVYAYSGTGVARVLAAPKPQGASRSLLVVANPQFGSGARFSSLADDVGQRPIDTPSRPIDLPSRPIDQPSRPIDVPSRPIDVPSRAIDSVSRAIDSLSREYAPDSSGGSIVPLPGTQREADGLRRIFPGATVLAGPGAQEGRFKALAQDYRFIHLATHGFVNDTSPMLSSVILAQPSEGSREDGLLTAREISRLRLRAEMVVMSACNTARGEVRSGEGMVGMAWSLFVAGCPTQVVSQWAVNDASAADLMVDFYRNLSEGKPKGQSLREAALRLRRDKSRSHPHYWAPFVVIGDWR
jgi:CHAT domain-containing protein